MFIVRSRPSHFVRNQKHFVMLYYLQWNNTPTNIKSWEKSRVYKSNKKNQNNNYENLIIFVITHSFRKVYALCTSLPFFVTRWIWEMLWDSADPEID